MTTNIESTKNIDTNHLVQPVAPANIGALSPEELEKLAGGAADQVSAAIAAIF